MADKSVLLEAIGQKSTPGLYEIVFQEKEKIPFVLKNSPLNIKGTIDAPLRYLEKRHTKHDLDDCHILVNRQEQSINLIINECGGETISYVKGKLSISPEFTRLGINNDQYLTPTELSDKFRRNKAFFDTLQDSVEIITKLKNFKVRANTIIEKRNDNRGNMTDLREQAIGEINLPQDFTLNVPVFKGFKPIPLKVSIEVRAEDFSVTLFSEDAYTQQDEMRNTIIDSVLDSISEICPNLVVIEE